MPFDKSTYGLDLLERWTWWHDKYGRTKQEASLSCRKLVEIITEQSQIKDKLDLPLISAGLFGNIADPRSGSYRIKRNLLLTSAAILDYDIGDPAWLAMVEENCRRHGVAALIVSTSSWTPEHQTYRLIFPCCELHDEESALRMVARADAVINGTAAPESLSCRSPCLFRARAQGPSGAVREADRGYADRLRGPSRPCRRRIAGDETREPIDRRRNARGTGSRQGNSATARGAT